MKILFMTPDFSDNVSVNYIYHLEEAMDKYAECWWAGRGYPDFLRGENTLGTVERAMPDADWVIFHEREIVYLRKNIVDLPKKREFKAALYTYDLHWNPKARLKWYNAPGWDAFLMRKTKIAVGSISGTKRFAPIDPNFYVDRLNAPIFYNAPSVNPEVFRPLETPKQYDATLLGAHPRKYYPLRQLMWDQLPAVSKKNGWRIMMRGAPPGHVMKKRTITKLLKEGHIVGPKYAETIALSKVFLFGTSIFKEALLKFPEGMACRTCILSDTPLTAKELHYVPDWNYVEISKGNWSQKLRQYLRNENRREEIAKRGYETFLKHHTSDVRARQLVQFLEEHM